MEVPSPITLSKTSRPIALIILGMAGSGKTTFCQRVLVSARDKTTFALNLDPAVVPGEEEDDSGLPYEPNVDVRDSVDYKAVMKEYGLGPNGSILTCLNLYATRFHEVVEIMERRMKQGTELFVVDTPGQIEVFTWSASGSIVTESIAGTMPTVLVYVVDTPRTKSPSTFCSNMLYACSVMFRTKLPMVLVFNKIDVQPHDFALEWMDDVDAFQEAVEKDSDSDGYMSSLTCSMGLVLNEFYSTLQTVGVSSATGAGMDSFFAAIEIAVQDYDTTYLPEVQARRTEVEKRKNASLAAVGKKQPSSSSNSAS